MYWETKVLRETELSSPLVQRRLLDDFPIHGHLGIARGGALFGCPAGCGWSRVGSRGSGLSVAVFEGFGQFFGLCFLVFSFQQPLSCEQFPKVHERAHCLGFSVID